MIRDYSKFLPPSGSRKIPKREPSSLEKFGWKPFFSQQIDVDAAADAPPVRVVEVHRTGLRVLGESLDTLIPPVPNATVGDWLLYDPQKPSNSQVLERRSVFARRAPGSDRKRQLIAANVDTVFIVSSCNKDFNIARLERYVALAFEAQVTPVIVLTKADLCDNPEAYVKAANTISNRVLVEALNALSEEPNARLAPWCKPGQTIAFLGSSGVGKSTLVNALFREGIVDTAAIREDDSKGRHTTTRRQLHFTAEGCAVLDTPGMRELQLTDVEAGIADVFADIVALARQCRFRDCRHDSEPGCAIQGALERDEIDPDRLARWNKLTAEERFNASSLAERKTADKALHKMINAIQQKNRK
ncbi:Putative ribosome biogenesis GTPase RsgA [Thalassovita gelatinovora]|uniref:Small ribosomal subunit biogenesis GTPase RsgA n=1 Tax=Thalassovita gelatinovora TaxID=53501 RepID=A0A0P1F756_THAGE|nr:ribosome small subunit-dependent GTPase A [Thalassovita gelatinovora]QIZ82235.1 ribosome small subunit-dependent GTPase A [Thalassovita gelatinovora]CUH63757.1 Putative ribosome biogenesis GTPase RsgA [Thalassovita gelatinovora]SEQ98159.1 ribosome biogenesis GTPase [Thalassovita gelatinovora]